MTLVTATTGDQFDVGAAAVALGPLANNGGPTPTHELLPGSVAIDAGSSFGATTDQRGETRPCDQAAVANAAGGDASDIGAFEVQGTCAPPNSPPDALDDSATFEVNSGLHTIAVLANDSEPDGELLSLDVFGQGKYGAVTSSNGKLIYTPNANLMGDVTDSFPYSIRDGKIAFWSGTVTINLGNQGPVAKNDSGGTHGEAVTLNLTANDTDPDGDTLKVNPDYPISAMYGAVTVTGRIGDRFGGRFTGCRRRRTGRPCPRWPR